MESFDRLRRAIVEQLDPLAALAEYELEFHSGQVAFKSELRFQEASPQLQELVPAALEAYDYLNDYNARLRQALEEGNPILAGVLLERVQRRLDQLQRCFARLNELPREALSPSPYVSELLRCGNLFLDGKLSAELLREKLQGVLQHMQGFLAQLEVLQPDPEEAEAYEKLRGRLDTALDEFVAAGFDLDAALGEAERDGDVVGQLLAKMRVGTDEIYRIQQELKEAADRGFTRSCVRCGASNEVSARYCRECQAALPALVRDQTGVLNLLEGGDESGLPPLVQPLLELLQSVAQGERAPDELRRELARQWARLKQVESGLGQLKGSESWTPEERSTFAETRDGISQGLHSFREGLELADEYFAGHDPAYLNRAYSILENAALALAEVQSRGNRWLQAAR